MCKYLGKMNSIIKLKSKREFLKISLRKLFKLIKNNIKVKSKERINVQKISSFLPIFIP